MRKRVMERRGKKNMKREKKEKYEEGEESPSFEPRNRKE